MTEATFRDTSIGAGIQELVVASGTNSRDHGFHEDWPKFGLVAQGFITLEEFQTVQRRAIAEKLALVHEEVSEMLGEIRSGRDPLEVYFVDNKGLTANPGLEYEEQQYNADGVPLCKPEGFLVEAADAIIRLGDLAYLVGDGDGAILAGAQRIKHEYNATRPFKHGRKF